MSEIIGAAKGLGNLGIAGLICWLIYKLVDKWAPLFLEAQKATSSAMVELASAVKQGLEEQRETLIAIRVLARDMGDVKEYMREIAEGKK